MDAFKIRGSRVMEKELTNDETVVSFLELPAYTSDRDIIGKLQGWGVSAVSPVKRRMWPGTKIADGTRLVQAKGAEQRGGGSERSGAARRRERKERSSAAEGAKGAEQKKERRRTGKRVE